MWCCTAHTCSNLQNSEWFINSKYLCHKWPRAERCESVNSVNMSLVGSELSHASVQSAASTLTLHSSLPSLSSGCFFSVLRPLCLAVLSVSSDILCPVLYLICMQPFSAALWHLSAIIWSGNCCVCLGLCFCLLVCPPCAFCARHPEAGPPPIVHHTSSPLL